MTMYQKKPDTIEAVLWDPEDPSVMTDWLFSKGISFTLSNGNLSLFYPMQNIQVAAGQYVAASRAIPYFVIGEEDLNNDYAVIE